MLTLKKLTISFHMNGKWKKIPLVKLVVIDLFGVVSLSYTWEVHITNRNNIKSCKTCGHMFIPSSELKLHMRSSHEKNTNKINYFISHKWKMNNKINL